MATVQPGEPVDSCILFLQSLQNRPSGHNRHGFLQAAMPDAIPVIQPKMSNQQHCYHLIRLMAFSPGQPG